MTSTIMLGALSLSAASLALSIFALYAARRTSGPSLSRRLSELSTQLQDQAQDVETIREELVKALNRERTRANMHRLRNQRATEHDAPANGADPEAEKDRWTRETNLKIARGELKPFGRR